MIRGAVPIVAIVAIVAINSPRAWSPPPPVCFLKEGLGPKDVKGLLVPYEVSYCPVGCRDNHNTASGELPPKYLAAVMVKFCLVICLTILMLSNTHYHYDSVIGVENTSVLSRQSDNHPAGADISRGESCGFPCIVLSPEPADTLKTP